MRKPAFTGQFKQDRKRAKRRGRNIARLDELIARLVADEPLEARYRVHPLRGNHARHWECHVEPDFLLIWYYSEDGEIVFVRAGTHADLFE